MQHFRAHSVYLSCVDTHAHQLKIDFETGLTGYMDLIKSICGEIVRMNDGYPEFGSALFSNIIVGESYNLRGVAETPIGVFPARTGAEKNNLFLFSIPEKTGSFQNYSQQD